MLSVWLRFGSERLLHEERRLPLPSGLPAPPRHALHQLWGIRGGGGGDSPGEVLPPGLLCLHHVQVNLNILSVLGLGKGGVRLISCLFCLPVDSHFLRATTSPLGEKTASVIAVLNLCLLRIRSVIPIVSTSMLSFLSKGCRIEYLSLLLDCVSNQGTSENLQMPHFLTY